MLIVNILSLSITQNKDEIQFEKFISHFSLHFTQILQKQTHFIEKVHLDDLNVYLDM